MNDIAPELLKNIQSDFQSGIDKSEIISQLYRKVRDGTATYIEANDFAVEAGNILAEAYKKNLSVDVLPDGKMYYNIAERIINPTMTNNYDLITDVTEQVQQSLNKNAGIGIKTITPELNQDRIEGIINKVSVADSYDDVAWVLDEPVKNFLQSIVDESIKVNAEFQSKAGLKPKIVRKLSGSCCDWCRTLAGAYSYPDVPNDVYRRHQRCRCTVDYDPRSGKIQNVHSKQWQSKEDEAKIVARKTIGIKDTKQAKTQRFEKAKEITAKNLDRMSLGDLRKLATETATEYYKSGMSGISFGNTDVEKAAKMLAAKGSRISLKKDILSMRKKMKKR